MPDSGHGSHFQFPEEFAEAAARFLAADWHPSHCP
jgi:pimeloyl-ACP methyl ester carboxylesterase